MKKIILALVVALALSFGCAGVQPINSEVANGYPQMQTEEMVEFFTVNGCEIFGAYNHQPTDAWIVWGKCLETPVCDSFIATPTGIIPFESCGEGYEAYRILCKELGDCI